MLRGRSAAIAAAFAIVATAGATAGCGAVLVRAVDEPQARVNAVIEAAVYVVNFSTSVLSS